MAPRRKLARLTGALAAIFLAILLMAGIAALATRDRERPVRTGRPDRIELVQVSPAGTGWLLLTFVAREGPNAVAVNDGVLTVRLLPRNGRGTLDEAARFETRVGPAHWRSVSPEETRFEVELPCNLARPLPPGAETVEARVTLALAGGVALEGATRFVPQPER